MSEGLPLDFGRVVWYDEIEQMFYLQGADMSTNRNKRACALPGCRAWAKRGETLCSSHLRSGAVRRHSGQVLPLLRAVATPATLPPGQGTGPEGAIEVIDRELEQLLEARRFFRSWVEDQRRREERGDLSGEDGPRALSPAQFMHAWNGSTMRVIQLVKARRELLGDGASAADALIQQVLDEVAQGLPGDPPASTLDEGNRLAAAESDHGNPR